VPIGTEVVYGCQNDFVFSNDWYMTPVVRIKCLESGVFSQPPAWPVCVDRKPIFSVKS
jgi:hypothetical protein